MDTCQMDSKAACIQIVPIFAGLSQDEVAEIAQIASTRAYARREEVYQAGDKGGKLFVVHTGQIKIYRVSQSGREQVLRVVGPGDFMGELSLFSALPLTDYAQATKAASVCVLEGDKLKQLMVKYPGIALKVMGVLSTRLDQANQQVEAISITSVSQRLAQALLNLAEDKPVINLPVSKGDFASQLGMSQETLSRRLAAMQEEGIISLSGQRSIRITDKQALMDLMEEDF